MITPRILLYFVKVFDKVAHRCLLLKHNTQFAMLYPLVNDLVDLPARDHVLQVCTVRRRSNHMFCVPYVQILNDVPWTAFTCGMAYPRSDSSGESWQLQGPAVLSVTPSLNNLQTCIYIYICIHTLYIKTQMCYIMHLAGRSLIFWYFSFITFVDHTADLAYHVHICSNKTSMFNII